MSPHRIALAIAILWSACCLALAAVVFVNLPRIESPERYLALVLGLAMLFMGGSMLAGVIWPPKPKDPNAPIVIPPLDQVRGRTSYRDDSTMTRNVMLAIGVIFLAASLSAAAEQPIVLVIAVIAVGVLAGGVVQTLKQIQYGRARLELDAPARRGDRLHGVITTSGSAWNTGGRNVHATVALTALRTYGRRGQSQSFVVASSSADIAVTRNGNDLTIRFTTTIPVIDTSEGRFSWNVQFETRSPKHGATFVIDVA